MTDLVWNEFVNHNIIPTYILSAIAEKIMDDIELTDRELSVYSSNSTEIEYFLKIYKNGFNHKQINAFKRNS